MKIFVLFFSTYVLMLSTINVSMAISHFAKIEVTDCCADCNKTIEKEHKNAKPKEYNKQCNPFQVCLICCGYVVLHNNFNFKLIEMIKYESTSYLKILFSSFISNSFDPPEVI